MREYFKNQLNYLPDLTQDVLNRAEYKTVWSGKRMQPGDKVVYAYVYVPNTDDMKIASFLDRELDDLSMMFNFIKLEDDMMPILSFKNDNKHRSNG
jgi:hypothetical protein